MKTYKAFVQDKQSKQDLFIEDSDYTSKEDFRKNLVANGYKVHRIELKEVYDYVLDNTNCNDWDFEEARKLFKK